MRIGFNCMHSVSSVFFFTPNFLQIFQVRVPKRSINVHLDECLQEQAGGPRKKPPQTTTTTPNPLSSGIPKKAPPSLKPMRKVVYHLIKDSELKKMLKAEGLSVKGNRKTLEWRHKRFTVLWNSQVCSLMQFCYA